MSTSSGKVTELARFTGKDERNLLRNSLICMGGRAPFDPEDFLIRVDRGDLDGSVADAVQGLSDAQVEMLVDSILKKIRKGKTG